jgi:hypothetical protein
VLTPTFICATAPERTTSSTVFVIIDDAPIDLDVAIEETRDIGVSVVSVVTDALIVSAPIDVSVSDGFIVDESATEDVTDNDAVSTASTTTDEISDAFCNADCIATDNDLSDTIDASSIGRIEDMLSVITPSGCPILVTDTVGVDATVATGDESAVTVV